jgi:hypothetical protein
MVQRRSLWLVCSRVTAALMLETEEPLPWAVPRAVEKSPTIRGFKLLCSPSQDPCALPLIIKVQQRLG